MQKEYVLFSRDYYPSFGGVAHYTFNFFNSLKKLKPETSLIVIKGSTGGDHIHFSNIVHERNLGNRFLDSFFPFRKLNTILHYFNIRRQSQQDIKEYSLQNRHLIVTACYDIQTLIFLEECAKKKISYSIVLHGLDIIKQKQWPNLKWTQLFYKVIAASENLIFNSKATKRLFDESIEINKRSTVLYPGIDPTYIDNELKIKNIEEDNFIEQLGSDLLLLSVGSLVKRKGFDIAIRAFKDNLETIKSSGIKYLIAGNGAQKEELESVIAENDLSDKVQLLGGISDGLKFKLMKRSSLFLMPSYTMDGNDIEGFGIVFLEAAYLNNYIIGGASGGMPEAIAPSPQGSALKINGSQDQAVLSEQLNVVLSQIIEKGKIETNADWISNFYWDALIPDFLHFLNNNK